MSAGGIEVYTSQSIVSTHKTLYIPIYTVKSMFYSAIMTLVHLEMLLQIKQIQLSILNANIRGILNPHTVDNFYLENYSH